MAWDPKIYMNFAAERTRPAAELLRRVPMDAPKRVVDLGAVPAIPQRCWWSAAGCTSHRARFVTGDVG